MKRTRRVLERWSRSHCPPDDGQYWGVDKSLARPGRKNLQRPNSNFCKPLKKKKSEGCPSNQVSAAATTSASDEKWRPFNCFFSRVGLKTYQHPCTYGRNIQWKKQLGWTVYVLCLCGLCLFVIKKVLRRNVGEQNDRLTKRSQLTRVSGENFRKILEKILLSQRSGRGQTSVHDPQYGASINMTPCHVFFIIRFFLIR